MATLGRWLPSCWWLSVAIFGIGGLLGLVAASSFTEEDLREDDGANGDENKPQADSEDRSKKLGPIQSLIFGALLLGSVPLLITTTLGVWVPILFWPCLIFTFMLASFGSWGLYRSRIEFDNPYENFQATTLADFQSLHIRGKSMLAPLPVIRLEQSLEVENVAPFSLAAAEDIQPGDLLLSLNGKPARDVDWKKFDSPNEELTYVFFRAAKQGKPEPGQPSSSDSLAWELLASPAPLGITFRFPKEAIEDAIAKVKVTDAMLFQLWEEGDWQLLQRAATSAQRFRAPWFPFRR